MTKETTVEKAVINRPKGGYCTPLQEALESDTALFECFKTNIETSFTDAYNVMDWSKDIPQRQLIVDVAEKAAETFLRKFINGRLHD